MEDNYNTERLILKKLSTGDEDFIFALLNTEGWIKFIGNRNINNLDDAANYIQKITNDPAINYWVASIKEDQTAIGLVTLIKRDYLEHSDIGFAFLPSHGKKGYAWEAASFIVNEILKDPAHAAIVAITMKDNTNSIRLLEKLGLTFSNEMQRDGEELLMYSVMADK